MEFAELLPPPPGNEINAGFMLSQQVIHGLWFAGLTITPSTKARSA
jgi:hypothetical protein